MTTGNKKPANLENNLDREDLLRIERGAPNKLPLGFSLIIALGAVIGACYFFPSLRGPLWGSYNPNNAQTYTSQTNYSSTNSVERTEPRK
jgi:hypothetical protein